jgi:NarL family two-component system response regulator YdfI
MVSVGVPARPRVLVVSTSAALRLRVGRLVEESGFPLVGARTDVGGRLGGEVEVIVLAGESASVLANLPAGVGVVLVGQPPADASLAAWATRAWGLVDADADAPTLAAAIQAVAAGLRVMPGGVRARWWPSEGARPVERVDPTLDEPLTPREHDVLELVAQGLSNHAIAGRLGISDHTVKFHLASIYGKLGVRSRTGAVRRGLTRGLIAI